MCLPAILLSLLAGALGMSAFFGILLPALFSVPAIRAQLGGSDLGGACPAQYQSANFAPVTNAVSTATGIILKREDFNRPSGPVEPASFQLQLASQPVEIGTR